MIAALPLIFRWWPLAAALVAFGTGWTVNGWRIDANRTDELIEQRKAQIARQDQINAKAEGLEQQLSRNEAARRALTRRLTHETRKDAYRHPVPDEAVRILNKSLFP